MSKKATKIVGIVIDCMMFAIMLFQMLYVFEGNVIHEVLGILLFVCLITHLTIKKWWIKQFFSKKNGAKKTLQMRLFDITTWSLLAVFFALMLSSMGVSRTLFPSVTFFGSPLWHRLLATAALTLSVLHGSFHMYRRAKNKRMAVIIIVLMCGASMAVGLALVPYLNRHFKKVDIVYADSVYGEKMKIDKKVAAVYFTRNGNSDFEEDVDAVSGASLLLADGRLTGNTELMAAMVNDITGCDTYAITLTGEKYPSSYSDTISVATKEMRGGIRPEIVPIDISGYEDIILIYPLWWGTIPMPVETFLAGADFTGKNVYLLATQGSSGFGSSTKAVRELLPGVKVEEGLSIYCDDIPYCRETIENYLKDLYK